MDLIWKLPVIALLGYLCGNFQTGIIVSRLMGNFDIRKKGSKNAGTTNVMRTMGWLPGVLTLVGDVLKGFAGGWIGMALLGVWGARLGGLMAVIGHNWPALFHFKGGKGIATSLGVVLVFDPLIGLCLVICQVLVLAATHIMSIASIASACLLSVMTVFLHFGDWSYMGFAFIITALAIFSHRENIRRLKGRKENALDFKEIDEISKGKKSK